MVENNTNVTCLKNTSNGYLIASYDLSLSLGNFQHEVTNTEKNTSNDDPK